MKKLLVFTVMLFLISITQVCSQTQLNDQPGLDSGKFIAVSNNKNFSFNIPVKFRWHGIDNYAIATYDTLWHPISEVKLAYNVSEKVRIFEKERNKALSAIKIIHTGNTRWSTIYAECQLHEIFDIEGKYAILFWMTKQPSFMIGASKENKDELKEEVFRLIETYRRVGTKGSEF